jgi:hypothetical protein
MVKLIGAVLQLLSVNVPKIVFKLKLNAYVYCCFNSILHRLPMKGSTFASAAPQTSVLPPSLKPVKFEIHVPEGRLYVTQKEERL